MKNATKFCIITIVVGMLLAFTIFTLFANGILTLANPSLFLSLIHISSGPADPARFPGSEKLLYFLYAGIITCLLYTSRCV